jgi:hypothetical protein
LCNWCNWCTFKFGRHQFIKFSLRSFFRGYVIIKKLFSWSALYVLRSMVLKLVLIPIRYFCLTKFQKTFSNNLFLCSSHIFMSIERHVIFAHTHDIHTHTHTHTRHDTMDKNLNESLRWWLKKCVQYILFGYARPIFFQH